MDGYNMFFRYARHCTVIIKNAIHGKGVNILASRKVNLVPRGRDRIICWLVYRFPLWDSALRKL